MSETNEYVHRMRLVGVGLSYVIITVLIAFMILAFPSNHLGNLLYFTNTLELLIGVIIFTFLENLTLGNVNYTRIFTTTTLVGVSILMNVAIFVLRVIRINETLEAEAGTELRTQFPSELMGSIISGLLIVVGVLGIWFTLSLGEYIKRNKKN
jgi:hypothetical protein